VFHYAAVLATGIFGVSPRRRRFALLYHASQFVPITLAAGCFSVREEVTLGEATRALRAPVESDGGRFVARPPLCDCAEPVV
jgi:hypothetical protein